jgi:hypothetical protein
MSVPPTQGGSQNGASPGISYGGDPAGVRGTISGLTAERPEIVVGAAFAGGLALAILVRRLAR